MITGWMVSVLFCHALGVFDGNTRAVDAQHMPQGVLEVQDCLRNYSDGALYNVGPHLVLKNWTFTHTQLSVFCRTNVTDVYRCIDPHLQTETDLTSSIIRTLEHLCDETQQPEWLRHSTCVPYGIKACLSELQDKEAVVTLFGSTVVPAKITSQCRWLKNYVTCVYGGTKELCGKEAADWHLHLIRKQWMPYGDINVCDIFNDKVVTPPPPDVAGVMMCMQNYTDSVLYNVGRHLVLKNHTLTEDQVSTFCKTDVLDLYRCIEPYRESAKAKTITGSLFKTFEHLCDDKQKKEWVKHSNCVLTQTCVEELQDTKAWVTMYEVKIDGEKVPDHCRYMKDYVKCVHTRTVDACGTAAADWHADVIRRIWRPYRDIIACDVYGPTGGVAGVVSGIVVGLLLIAACGLLIWYNPKKPKTERQLRASTAL